MEFSLIIKAIGWIGSLSYVGAYLLLSLGKISSNKRLYHILNIIGASGLIANAFYLNDYPNLATNMVWALIALLAIYRIGVKEPF